MPRRSLFFTTMSNHRPVIYSKIEDGDSNKGEVEAPRQFHLTAARDPTITPPNQNPNHPPPRTLSDLLARSTQPIFSVSAMFRMKAGGGCGACGH
jgi:hypothetical protein